MIFANWTKNQLRTGLLAACVAAAPVYGVAQASRPVHLQCDSLTNPLGVDDPHPLFSWQLQDPAQSAKQTAYELQIATDPSLLAAEKPDVWKSGRIQSAQSLGIAYGGPALAAERRYYWQVKLWAADEKPYPSSEVNWFETGLLTPDGWRAKWVGFEQEDLKRVRESEAAWIWNPGEDALKHAKIGNHQFRSSVQVPSPVDSAILYVAGKDTPAAWVNGKQVLVSQPLPPWKQLPWGTYVPVDVTGQLHPGNNSVSVEVTVYKGSGYDNFAGMSAVLLIHLKDGSVIRGKSGPGWKATADAPAHWTDPSFDDAGWQHAQVVAAAGTAPLGRPWPVGPVKCLRKAFEVSKSIHSARIYATALGAYQIHLNGQLVSDQILSPGWTDYRHEVTYQVYDVTAIVKKGSNAIAAYLAPGWYSTPLQWFRQPNNYGNTQPALRAQIRIEHADGSVEWIATDESWKAALSPIEQAEIYDGETYDARLEQAGWDRAEFSDAKWQPAQLVQPSPEPAVVSQYFQPIRVEKTLNAKTVTSPQPGVYIFDFGQDLTGFAHLQVEGPRGTNIRLRFAEVLNPDGTMYVENLRTAKATDHFILAGNGAEEYQPRFTFHGFRYVELTGLSAKPDLSAVKAVVFHTDAPFTAQLHTASPLINQLWSNIMWGQRSNFLGVPTDCPQRDERLGWTGDAQVFWRTASYNMNLSTFSNKYATDVRHTQQGTSLYGIYAPATLAPSPGFAAGWSDAGVIVPWTAWLQFNDVRIVEENWSAMEAYLAEIQAANPDFLWKNKSGAPFGDWLAPGERTPEDLIATAYWAYDARLMQQMAHALGYSADEQKYQALFDSVKAAFNQAYVHPDGTVSGRPDHPDKMVSSLSPGKVSAKGDSQTSYVLALHMDLLPHNLRARAAQKLVAKIAANHWRLGTGFLGTPYLLEVLTDTGHSDLAYRLLLNTDYPSWGYLVEHGATTMWERWNGDQMLNDPAMNSFNHYAYGAVAEWIYRYAAGIDALSTDPGFHTIDLHPNFDKRLGSLDFTYMSPYGLIKSAWSVKGASTDWTVTIPANTAGHLRLTAEQAAKYSVAGEPIRQSNLITHAVASRSGETTYTLPAGTYTFAVRNPK
jgi:alpha-L-rhamnosidase